MKSFKYLKIQFGTHNGKIKSNHATPQVYKHSTYLQSKDSSWINRNKNIEDFDEEIEPIEEDIRD